MTYLSFMIHPEAAPFAPTHPATYLPTYLSIPTYLQQASRIRKELEDDDDIDGDATGLTKIYESLMSVPWGSFVRSKELWAVTAAHMVGR